MGWCIEMHFMQGLIDDIHEDDFPAATHNPRFLEAQYMEAHFLFTRQSNPNFPSWELSPFCLLDLPSPSPWTSVCLTGG